MQAELVLADSPSLKPQLEPIAAEENPNAIRRAIADLGDFSEIDRATERALLGACYTVDQILGDWFPPEPTATPSKGKR